MPEPIDPGLNEVAAALGALRPNPPALDRDRLLFRAGRASAPRPWPWQLTAAVSATAAALLAALLVFRPAPTPVERVVVVHDLAPAPPKPEETPAPPAAVEAAPPTYSWPNTPYRRLEDNVLRWGLDGVPQPPPSAEGPADTRDSLLKSL